MPRLTPNCTTQLSAPLMDECATSLMYTGAAEVTIPTDTPVRNLQCQHYYACEGLTTYPYPYTSFLHISITSPSNIVKSFSLITQEAFIL